MKLASKLKLDQQPCPPSVASHLLHQVDQFLSASDKMSHPAALEDLNALARKLDNPKLLDQCKVLRTSFFFLNLFYPYRKFLIRRAAQVIIHLLSALDSTIRDKKLVPIKSTDHVARFGHWIISVEKKTADWFFFWRQWERKKVKFSRDNFVKWWTNKKMMQPWPNF